MTPEQTQAADRATKELTHLDTGYYVTPLMLLRATLNSASAITGTPEASGR